MPGPPGPKVNQHSSVLFCLFVFFVFLMSCLLEADDGENSSGAQSFYLELVKM